MESANNFCEPHIMPENEDFRPHFSPRALIGAIIAPLHNATDGLKP